MALRQASAKIMVASLEGSNVSDLRQTKIVVASLGGPNVKDAFLQRLSLCSLGTWPPNTGAYERFYLDRERGSDCHFFKLSVCMYAYACMHTCVHICISTQTQDFVQPRPMCCAVDA